ncbi:hypothetical protein JOF53_006451 [Crossiella equi]|uniref:Uncharacterized protein n=1 Tax=Crossiella equi TaxID=130796 RepID=A0ABS5AN18_9PSEU|nr:hypothetical protein [Crossiella equi]MBP2477579.1 hypothetical protein [Crossiella equi]
MRTILLLLSVLGISLIPVSSAAASSTQAVVCEYEVAEPGVGGYGSHLFFPHQAITFFWPYSKVWGTPTIAWNRNAGAWVRHLAGSGGYWTYSDKLRRTGAKCLPL